MHSWTKIELLHCVRCARHGLLRESRVIFTEGIMDDSVSKDDDCLFLPYPSFMVVACGEASSQNVHYDGVGEETWRIIIQE